MPTVIETCAHVDQVKIVADRDDVQGCDDCLKMGDTWVHLRACLTCGYVGCCDSSRNQHARQHFNETLHPIIQSVEPGEKWAYCYLDEAYYRQPPSPAV